MGMGWKVASEGDGCQSMEGKDAVEVVPLWLMVYLCGCWEGSGVHIG
jgi:hypothetical protein